ncbi:hypothetical protein EV673_2253 [Limnobacter thiooxidans]|nr:hypothetical protein EV673_2253 [Limnobacter thiooxidans]
MSTLAQFSTPANVQDFSNPAQQALMNTAWSGNVNRWVEASLVGDVWDLVNYGPRPAFYNPLTTDVPAIAANAAIPWQAFPGRISALFSNNSNDWFEWADNGVTQQVTTDLCTQQSITPIPYPPTGPRGWQDEYCEWSVQRNSNNQITSVMFTCENPEYWFTLWEVSPAQVLALYQSLVSPNVQLADLCVPNVNDPITGQPAYNPLNKWNAGTQTLPNSGGAVHLTSSPNTLGAEFDLAAAATIPRSVNGQPVQSASQLVCCAKYGKIGRHSDPTIGQTVNQVVNYTASLPQAQATLTNPVGLYMQTPNFTQYTTPDGTPASEFWTVVRGELKNPSIPGDIDRILHATFEVPASKGYTVSDITIAGSPIQWASQITNTFQMSLMATVFANSGVTQTALSCTSLNNNPSAAVSAIQDATAFAAYRSIEQQMNELPLSIPILAFPLEPGMVRSNVALMLNTGDAPSGGTFKVVEGDVDIQVTGMQSVAGMQVYIVTLTAGANAKPGDKTILASIPGMPSSQQAAIGLLTVVGQLNGKQSSLAGQAKPYFRKGRA